LKSQDEKQKIQEFLRQAERKERQRIEDEEKKQREQAQEKKQREQAQEKKQREQAQEKKQRELVKPFRPPVLVSAKEKQFRPVGFVPPILKDRPFRPVAFDITHKTPFRPVLPDHIARARPIGSKITFKAHDQKKQISLEEEMEALRRSMRIMQERNNRAIQNAGKN
jgi:hypothetical protein